MCSAGALVCAGLVLMGMGTVAAPLPDRGLAPLTQVAMAAPAALPDVPVPVSGPITQSIRPGPVGHIQIRLPTAAKRGLLPQLAFAAWATRMARVTAIPARALQAYAYAYTVTATSQPRCHLTWVTLAGIAEVESQHGTLGGRTLLADGNPTSPIIGIPLNGANGTKPIAATDGGLLDGDEIWEHAVGPFQFIPSAWALWRADAHGDGYTDPQNIDNAALAAANYLCAGNRNLAHGDDWLRAILSYNNSLDYVRAVYTFAQQYARRAQTLT
jgi:membrane-bound lytic murein transglycosylase B